MADRLLDPNETATRLGFTRRHLERLIAKGEDAAPPSVMIGRLRRFPESGVDAWIKRQMAAAERTAA